MRPNVKPLVHWVIYKGYTIRYTDRISGASKGNLDDAEG